MDRFETRSPAVGQSSRASRFNVVSVACLVAVALAGGPLPGQDLPVSLVLGTTQVAPGGEGAATEEGKEEQATPVTPEEGSAVEDGSGSSGEEGAAKTSSPEVAAGVLEELRQLEVELLGKVAEAIDPETPPKEPPAAASELRSTARTLPGALSGTILEATGSITAAAPPPTPTRVELALQSLRITLEQGTGRTLVAAAARAGAVAPANEKAQRTTAEVESELIEAFEQVLADVERAIRVEVAKTREILADPTLQTELAKVLERLAESEEEDFKAEFEATDGLAREARCIWRQDSALLECEPDGLLVSGEEISHIRVLGLPTDRAVTVRAWTSDTASTVLAEGHRECPEAGATLDLSCDELTLTPGSGAAHTNFGELLIAVHKNRLVGPSYCPSLSPVVKSSWWKFWCGRSAALKSLRAPLDREKLSLVLSSKPLAIVVGVAAGDAGPSRSVRSDRVPIAYRRWGFETHSFIAFSELVDDELLTEPTDDGKVRVLGVVDSDEYRQESGVFLNFVPQNYQAVGLGFGVHVGSQNAPSYYFGPSVRLRSLGSRAVATFSAGWAIVPVQRFPAIEDALDRADEDKMGKRIFPTFDLNDERLQGRTRYDDDGFVMLSLGIRFGPITGSGDEGE